MSNEVNGQRNVVRFNKDLAKKISQETFDDNGPADSQGIEIKSPGKMHWFTCHGESFDDLIQVHTTKLYDPDGELEEYIILAEDKSLREKIFNKADDNINVKALVRCTNWFGTEFLWLPAIKSKGNSKVASQSAKKAIERGLDGNWIKCKWKDGSVGWQSWSHPGTDKTPEWSKMQDEEIIEQVFDRRIITSLDHEALERNVGGK
jgi:hypothetical protein